MTSAAAAAIKKAATATIPSIGFSGAGFLTCYHLGVSDCLIQHGILSLQPEAHNDFTVLTGVSGGALCAAGVAVGVSPQDGMSTVLHVTNTTTQQGRLDALTPGFSLIDQVEEYFTISLKQALGGTSSSCNYDDYDLHLLQARVQNSRLRIGITDRRVYFPLDRTTRRDSYFYVDEFRSVEDIVAACILSSYIPFITGPAQGSQCSSNLAVKRSKERLQEMLELGFIKHGETGQPVQPKETDASHLREYFWDGGLVNVFPIVDESTVIVTPISARFSPNPYISPQVEDTFLSTRTIKVDERSEIYLNTQNVETLRQMTLSSEDKVMEEWFAQGFDDARYVSVDVYSLLPV